MTKIIAVVVFVLVVIGYFGFQILIGLGHW